MKKKLLTGLLLGALTIYSFIPAQAAGEQWIQQGNHWLIQDSSGSYRTGWVKMNEQWFYFNNQGFMVTGWILPKDGNWYYLNQESGQMVTGWNQINGKQYYFDPITGAMQTGWIKTDRNWYYFNTNTGEMLTGWMNINGTWYYLEKNGEMVTGWLDYNGSRYYLLSDGSMATDRVTINGIQYQFTSDGKYIETETTTSYHPNQNTEDMDQNSYILEVVKLVNKERQKEGLDALEIDWDLMNAAQVRANEIVEYYSHTRPNGSTCFSAFSEAGVEYTGAGENIAAGYKTPESAMNGWMNSSGHRANILGNFTHIGVGFQYDESGYKYFWVQCFIRK